MNETCTLNMTTPPAQTDTLRPTTSSPAQQIIGALYLLAITAALLAAGIG